MYCVALLVMWRLISRGKICMHWWSGMYIILTISISARLENMQEAQGVTKWLINALQQFMQIGSSCISERLYQMERWCLKAHVAQEHFVLFWHSKSGSCNFLMAQNDFASSIISLGVLIGLFGQRCTNCHYSLGSDRCLFYSVPTRDKMPYSLKPYWTRCLSSDLTFSVNYKRFSGSKVTIDFSVCFKYNPTNLALPSELWPFKNPNSYYNRKVNKG